MKYLIGLALLLLAVIPLAAQERVVTDDEVRDVAEHMFCPVCENEPLDDCRTATCVQWKEEIRNQLAAGRTEDEIIDDFIARYGQHVSAVPRDPLLYWLSFLAPILGSLAALIIGVMTFRRWQQNRPIRIAKTEQSPADDDYRSQIERDLM